MVSKRSGGSPGSHKESRNLSPPDQGPTAHPTPPSRKSTPKSDAMRAARERKAAPVSIESFLEGVERLKRQGVIKSIRIGPSTARGQHG